MELGTNLIQRSVPATPSMLQNTCDNIDKRFQRRSIEDSGRHQAVNDHQNRLLLFQEQNKQLSIPHLYPELMDLTRNNYLTTGSGPGIALEVGQMCDSLDAAADADGTAVVPGIFSAEQAGDPIFLDLDHGPD